METTATNKEMTMTKHNYATIDGHRIFYREAGPAIAPTIVLLHGYPSSSHMFRGLIPKLAGTFRVIAPDYLGFGFSDQPSAKEYRYTFDNLTGLVEKLLFGHLKLTKFSIYVQDYGTPVGFASRPATRRRSKRLSCRTATPMSKASAAPSNS
jgi:pimeloyl-ACP methyl ester carboxylesterase